MQRPCHNLKREWIKPDNSLWNNSSVLTNGGVRDTVSYSTMQGSLCVKIHPLTTKIRNYIGTHVNFPSNCDLNWPPGSNFQCKFGTRCPICLPPLSLINSLSDICVWTSAGFLGTTNKHILHVPWNATHYPKCMCWEANEMGGVADGSTKSNLKGRQPLSTHHNHKKKSSSGRFKISLLQMN